MAKGNYVHIERFMVDDLGLSGNELITYAIIHGFSQDGETWFTGSAAYIASWCGCKKQAALANLSKLVEKGLIEKREHIVNGVKLCDYRAVATGTENVYPVRKSYRGGTEIVPGGGTETVPHTIEDTIEETIGGERAKSAKPKETKHRHGEYRNVLLTDSELSKLKAEYPDWAERIDRLSEYIESKGARYKSHYATIRAWARKDAASAPQQQAPKRKLFDADEQRRKDEAQLERLRELKRKGLAIG